MEKVRVGVIGIGNMGTGHVRSFCNGDLPDFELTAICDLKSDRLSWMCEEIKGIYSSKNVEKALPNCYTDAIEMLASGDIDAVIIATPHYDHPVYVIEAIKRGIHVLSEKPAGVYTEKVREAIEVSKAHPEVVYAMMFNQRTDPMYIKMKELVSSGEIGEIKR